MKIRNLAAVLTSGLLGCNLANAGLETSVQENSQAGQHALIVVDMQQSFLVMVSPAELAEEIPYQIEVIQAAQRNNVPIFVLEFEGAGSTITELMDVVDDKGYELITKSHTDGFRETSMDSMLRAHNVGSVILGGVYASACVYATANGALGHGYEVITSPDIIADWFDETMDEPKDWYQEHGTWIESHDELVDYIDNL